MEGIRNIVKNIFKTIIMEDSSTQRLDKNNTDLIMMLKI